VILVEPPTEDHRVATITFNRPEVYNAMSSELSRTVASALEALDPLCSVIVLRGAGGNFSVGGDIAEVERLREEGPDALVGIFDAFGDLVRAIIATKAVVIAAVEGYALAGGFEILQVCDVVLLSGSAALGDHHIRAGQIPAGGGSQRLPRIVGRQRALSHLLSGDRLDAPTAVAWGLGYKWAPAEEFEAMVSSVVASIASKNAGALQTMKSLVDRGLEVSLEEGLAIERAAVVDPESWRSFR
jgi:enoyl-CoA hydratase/carnithine racemase